MNFSNVTNREREKKESRISPQEQRKARKEVRKSGKFGHQNLFSFIFSLSLSFLLWILNKFGSFPISRLLQLFPLLLLLVVVWVFGLFLFVECGVRSKGYEEKRGLEKFRLRILTWFYYSFNSHPFLAENGEFIWVFGVGGEIGVGSERWRLGWG